MKHALALIAAFLLLGATAGAQIIGGRLNLSQTATGAKSDKRGGLISGQLTDTAGQPIVNAVVYVGSMASYGRESHNTSTDEQGRFRVADLTRSVYFVSPNAPGYVTLNEERGERWYRAGDTANVRMTKGAVITGTVMNANNEPMTGCSVQAIRIRDKDGRPAAISRPGALDEADDRGVYRLYGLPAGTYIVIASGKPPYFNEGRVYENDVPTYYPSATRDTAQPVTLQAGEEANGIDIRYRGERGHAISGKILGHSAESANLSFQLQLFNLTSRTVEGATNVGAYYPSNNDGSFAFYGVPDSDYIIVATMNRFDSKLRGSSGRARVKVKGADATGVDITVVPYGAIAGTLVIEPLPSPAGESKCEIKSHLMPDEMLIKGRREAKASEPDLENINVFRQTAPSDKGAFELANLEAGQYHIELSMLGEDYFVRSITFPALAKTQPPTDAARAPLAVKSGERRDHLTITIAAGAAAVRGRVTPATEGARLPDRLHVYLVPAEKEAAGDVLRYGEAAASADGGFVLANLAPGHYFILARLTTDAEASDEAAPPVAWTAAEHAALLKQAAAANTVLELRPCQRMVDYTFKYAPAAQKKAAGGVP